MAILYFDDEPFISRTLAENLIFLGWKVELVSEINILFEKLANHKYDIIILDIMAPIPIIEKDSVGFNSKEIEDMEDGMNTGIVLAMKIWELYDKIPILFLSARTEPVAIAQFKKEGKKCEYIRKLELVITIDKILKEMLNE